MIRHRFALLPLAALLLISGCQRSSERKLKDLTQRVWSLQERNRALQAETEMLVHQELARERLLQDERAGLWGFDATGTQGTQPMLIKEYDRQKATAKMLERAFNQRHPPPKYPGIRVTRIKDGIAFVRLLDPEMLTERMGTGGAHQYVQIVTLTLTSLWEVDHVYLYGFDPGSHMWPGCWSRADIADWDI